MLQTGSGIHQFIFVQVVAFDLGVQGGDLRIQQARRTALASARANQGAADEVCLEAVNLFAQVDLAPAFERRRFDERVNLLHQRLCERTQSFDSVVPRGFARCRTRIAVTVREMPILVIKRDSVLHLSSPVWFRAGRKSLSLQTVSGTTNPGSICLIVFQSRL